ncbi:MAG TPA: amidohydrolase family protein [Pyrinomonadaceae bacterium]|nr:amidohydrolase family protein [Pyrinomonadaceae bacterium]
MTKLYCARWVLPVTTEPIVDGAVAVRGSLIAGVGPRAEIEARFPGAEAEDFGEAAILPGLVNCHTHLELTAMRGFLEAEEGDFFAWLRKLTIARGERMSGNDLYASAAWGAAEALRAGVTCVGDASDAGAAVMRALGDAGLRGVVFKEAFGPDARSARERFERARAGVEALRASETRLVRLGLSPHAPYTVSPPLLTMLAEYAVAESLPLMIHAAESEAEDLLMREGRGPFAEGFAARGIEFDAPHTSTVRHLAAVGLLAARPLLAHCVRVDDEDIRLIKEHGARVAHCPKSNAKLGHGRAPLAAMLAAGVRVGLGSDSVASNNTCDLLEEARFAVLAARAAGGGRMPGAADALRLATLGGAEALGLGGRAGALAEGLEADLVAVGLAGAHQRPVYDPASALVFASSGRDVLMTVVAGRELFRDGRLTTLDEGDLRARIDDLARRLAVEAPAREAGGQLELATEAQRHREEEEK